MIKMEENTKLVGRTFVLDKGFYNTRTYLYVYVPNKKIENSNHLITQNNYYRNNY